MQNLNFCPMKPNFKGNVSWKQGSTLTFYLKVYNLKINFEDTNFEANHLGTTLFKLKKNKNLIEIWYYRVKINFGCSVQKLMIVSQIYVRRFVSTNWELNRTVRLDKCLILNRRLNHKNFSSSANYFNKLHARLNFEWISAFFMMSKKYCPKEKSMISISC